MGLIVFVPIACCGFGAIIKPINPNHPNNAISTVAAVPTHQNKAGPIPSEIVTNKTIEKAKGIARVNSVRFLRVKSSRINEERLILGFDVTPVASSGTISFVQWQCEDVPPLNVYDDKGTRFLPNGRIPTRVAEKLVATSDNPASFAMSYRGEPSQSATSLTIEIPKQDWGGPFTITVPRSKWIIEKSSSLWIPEPSPIAPPTKPSPPSSATDKAIRIVGSDSKPIPLATVSETLDFYKRAVTSRNKTAVNSMVERELLFLVIDSLPVAVESRGPRVSYVQPTGGPLKGKSLAIFTADLPAEK
ncbi:MAG: hypothetical protein LC104_06740 [Bacteroidales bacterium]|nr:hypothetical protein [Bacteroidales bacterium]